MSETSLIALDPATGKEIWIHENIPGLSARGINYWQSKDGKDKRLLYDRCVPQRLTRDRRRS